MRFDWATRTSVGQVRDHNEDAMWPRQDGSSDELVVVGVADGMGGHAGGEVASVTALDTAMTVGGDAAVRIQAANLAVVDAAKLRPRLSGMGTTLTIAILQPDGTAEIGHVGDSRAYLFRNETLEQVTSDHSYVGQLLESGQLTPEQAHEHPFRSVVTRAIGLDPAVDIDTYSLQLAVGDRLLICSDGLSDMLWDDDIATLLTESEELGDAADALVTAAEEAGGADNITVVLVDVTA